ncbi:MAG: fatty acid desaturase [Oligoflexales bacterium]
MTLEEAKPQTSSVYGAKWHQTYTEEDPPSLAAIKKTIPKHCFESSLTKSLLYLFKDILLVTLSFFVMLYWGSKLASPFQEIAWVIYWFFQGTLFWALFVVGHDCGHESFSKYRQINNILGSIVHGFLLVPYKSWALSHRHHHKYTSNFHKDDLFAPEIESSKPWKKRKTHWTAKLRRLSAGMLGLMWLPYLIAFSKSLSSHFWPFDLLFKDNRKWVSISILVVFVFTAIFSWTSLKYGIWFLTAYYLIPWFIFASWLVITTFLHHNHEDVPWYSKNSWNFVKGSLSTMDRSYGIFNNLVHHIGTHQIHHLFSFIPHYHLVEATHHFRRAFPNHYRYCHDSIIKEYWDASMRYTNYGFMEKGEDHFSYKNAKPIRKNMSPAKST